MLKVTLIWNGTPGLPGYSNFYFLAGVENQAAANEVVGRVNTWASKQRPRIPTAVSMQVESNVQIVDAETGQLTGQFTATGAGGHGGTGTGPFAAPTGACIIWRTTTAVNGRFLKGKTFMVPLVGGCFEGNGTLMGEHITGITTDSTVMALRESVVGAVADLAVWHRPINGAGGSAFPVKSVSVADRAAVLTSRRG